jgi:hypothetical protein
MHVCSPELPYSKLLSKHPRFTLIRLTGILIKGNGNYHLLNDSGVLDSLYAIQPSKKPCDTSTIILFL